MAHRSKWQIMQDEVVKLEQKVKDLKAHMAWAERTLFKVSGSQEEVGRCSQCQTELRTEADFEKHFLVPDEKFRNLGYCPKGKDWTKGR
jgi:hypothetical protein